MCKGKFSPIICKIPICFLNPLYAFVIGYSIHIATQKLDFESLLKLTSNI